MYLYPIFFNIATFATLSAAGSTILVRNADNGSQALTWHVSKFTTGCSPGGCIYDFHILGIGTRNTPGFNTTCSGTDEQNGYKPCTDWHVRAQLKPYTYPVWGIKVEHVWTDKMGGEYMSIGEANVTSLLKTFNVTVSQVYGVS